MTPVRQAAVAGRFYPGHRQTLQTQVDTLLAEAGASTTPAAPKLLIVPHAGYIYSGAIAARAYAELAGRAGPIERVLLLGPAHGAPVAALAAPSVQAFETPLGRVPLDRVALQALAALPQVVVDDRAHAVEHSLEVQLPFLQRVLGEGFTLVPLAVGGASAGQVAEVLELLWGGAETLIVISTDLSHYHPYAQAQALDRSTVERIVAGATDLDTAQACGAHALNGALLALARRGLQPQLLDLRNSGDTAGDRQRVVGYAALLATDAATHQLPPPDEHEPALAPALLACARNAIAAAFDLPCEPEPSHPALARPGACFVTLEDAQRQLLGCIGNTETTDTLARQLRRHARAAAFDDPRFAPLKAGDVAGLRIEVSLLSPSRPQPRAASFADAAAALTPGVDGVTLRWPRGRATLLPQVWHALPAPEDFLLALMNKAGLPCRDRHEAARAWRDDITLQTYTARICSGPGPAAEVEAPR